MSKIKIQFDVDESLYNLLEAIRKKVFSSTTKQYLYERIFREWATYHSKDGRIF